MKTPILSISEDQNTITHESGTVTEFVPESEEQDCETCCYFKFNCPHSSSENLHRLNSLLCFKGRKDMKPGQFKLK